MDYSFREMGTLRYNGSRTVLYTDKDGVNFTISPEKGYPRIPTADEVKEYMEKLCPQKVTYNGDGTISYTDKDGITHTIDFDDTSIKATLVDPPGPYMINKNPPSLIQDITCDTYTIDDTDATLDNISSTIKKLAQGG